MKSITIITVSLCIFLFILPSVAQHETPPEGGTPKDFNLPQKKEFTTDNGLNVTMVQYGTIPTVEARLVIRVGNLDEKEDEIWLADLTTDFLKEGTQSQSAQDIAEQAAQIGGSINVSTGPDQTYISGTSLAEFAPQLIELMSDIVQHPAFPESELERLQNNYLRNLNVQKSQPQSIALERFRKILYPNHPYGRIFPSEELIKNYDIKKIKSFYKNKFGAQKSHLYIVGLFDESKVETAIRDKLSGWTPGDKYLEYIPKSTTEKIINVIDRPNAPQSTILLGLPVIDPSKMDYIALQVTNTLLGGSFGSRITSNIREDKGYTYSPRSAISTRFRDSYWYEQADVTTEFTGASLKEIFFEIDRLQNEPPSEEELKGIQNYLAGIFVLRNSSLTGIINQLSFIEFHGLPDSYLTNYIQDIYKVTPSDVQRLTRELIQDKKMTIVIVGDLKKIKQQVQPFGNVVF
jgi:predicted Zn-dependent peptidase